VVEKSPCWNSLQGQNYEMVGATWVISQDEVGAKYCKQARRDKATLVKYLQSSNETHVITYACTETKHIASQSLF
jgi:hypothetical protein